MTDIILEIRNELLRMADEKTRLSGMRFFREKVSLHGVKTALITQLAKEKYRTLSALGKDEVFQLCERLWQTGFMEESFIACHWSFAVRKKFASSDLDLFEAWIQHYVTNWASCDTFCNHTVGALLERYPEKLVTLKRWAVSDNLWMRRASAVSLIVPARQGKFLPEIFILSDLLLEDREDMVQKGYGWMLKVAGQAYPEEVFGYVMNHKNRMPRTALRYAIEKLPDEQKKKAMER